MKKIIIIFSNLIATFVLFYILSDAVWTILRITNANFSVETIMPFLLLISGVLANTKIQYRFLLASYTTATIATILHTITVLLLAPAWYPTLHWATILSFIVVGVYVNYRGAVARELAHNTYEPPACQ